jgi:hypothetical protein
MALHRTKTEHLRGRAAAPDSGIPEDWIPASYAGMAETVIGDQADDLAAADLYIFSPQM